ncbi:superoxide dismutase family protein [uncultured Novosphingobium sp.]|uniref:superoxide dismutase family protein n=1 Tax=uncultured Novosphingobium sp. TaxID=292277 RepID=UPI003749772A
MNRFVVMISSAAAIMAVPALADQAKPMKHGSAMEHEMAKPGAPMAQGAMVHADVIGADGKTMGMVMLQDTPTGVLVKTDLKGLPAGEHGFHFHEKGMCDAAQKFTTAGAHFAAGKMQHGLMVAGGPHGGDMPNAFVGADGMLKAELLNTGVTLAAGPKSLADADGSALVIHAKPDDYKTQPSGDAGDRIACAVVAAPKK